MSTEDKITDKKFGLLLAGIIGDSFGARYEFLSAQSVIKKLKEDKNQEKLLGGGTWGITPGQVTDDSEMALTLLQSIKQNDNIFDQSIVGNNYIKWHNSHPFDEGITTRNAFNKATSLDDIFKNTKEKNSSSLSNGCLMRIWSLMYYYSEKSDDEIVECAKKDCALTHPSDDCHQVVSAYCRMLKFAINGKNKSDIIKILDEYKSPVVKSIATVVNNNLDYIVLQTKEKERVKLDSGAFIGYIGLTYAIVLKEFIKIDESPSNKKKFVTFLADIASYGGDTDTNCCIGGALFGAYYGLKEIPGNYIEQVMSVNCDRYKKYPFANISNFVHRKK